MEVEVKSEERGAPEKRAADGLLREAALQQDEHGRQYRFPHFDVDTARWFYTDLVQDGALTGHCYRDRVTGRPILLCLVPESHYTLYIQVRGDSPGETAPLGFLVPLTNEVGFEMQSFLRETAEVYDEVLGELQISALEEVDEAEQARFLLQIRNGVALRRIEQELRAQLPPEQPVQAAVTEGRRKIKGRRRL